MAFDIKSVPGLSELHLALQDLPAKIEGNVMQGALRAGQKVFMEAVKNRMPPDDTGLLRRSVRIRTLGKSKKFGYIRTQVVVGNKQAWYARFLEFGTASYYTGTGKSVKSPYIIRAKNPDGSELSRGQKRRALSINGRFYGAITHPGIKPRPFMRPSFDDPTNQNDAIKSTADYVRGRLPREIKKMARLRAMA